MNMQLAQELWQEQTNADADPHAWSQAIAKHHQREKHQAWAFRALFVIGVFASLHFVYASYILREEHIVRALLSASLSAVGASTQIIALRALRRKQRLRQQSVNNQKQWLQAIVEDLQETRRRLSPTSLSVPLVLVLAVAGTLKLWDYRDGTDTAGECIGIFIAVVMVIFLLWIAAWYYRQQHLLPKLLFHQELLEETNS